MKVWQSIQCFCYRRIDSKHGILSVIQVFLSRNVPLLWQLCFILLLPPPPAIVYPLTELYSATGSLECLQLKTSHRKLGNVHIVSSFFI
jgi:hypothetical protein